MKREEKLLKNTLILSIGTILPKLAVFITLPIYTKYLTKTEYGIYDLIASVVLFLVPLITLQIQDGIFRYLLEEKNSENKSKIITTTTIFVTLTTVIIGFIAFFVLRNIEFTLRILILLYFLFYILLQVVMQIARGIGENKKYSVASIINSFFNIVLVIPLLVCIRLGINGLMLSLTVSMIVSIIYLAKSIKLFKYLNFKYWDFNYLKNIMKYSIPMIPNSIAWWVINLSDRLIITNKLGLEQNAIYAASNKIPSIYNIAYTTFNMAWQESATVEKNSKDVCEYYSNIFKNLLELLFGAILVIIAVSPIIFRILIDSSYNEAMKQMPILFLALFFLSFANFYGGIYVAFKKTKKVAKSSLWGAIINIVVNLLFIKRIGLYAASISTLISYVFITIYRAIDIQKEFKIKYEYKKIFICLVLLIAECLLININNWIFYIINIIITISVFVFINKMKLIFIIKNLKNRRNVNI